MTLLYGLILAAFLLAIWWLAFHPEFGAPPRRERGESPEIVMSTTTGCDLSAYSLVLKSVYGR